MVSLTLGLAGWAVGLLVLLFLSICVVLILTVLIQRPAGGGLSGAFGSGAGSGQTAFGAKTGDALTIATIAMFVIYIVSAVGLNFAVRPASPLTQPIIGAPGEGGEPVGAGQPAPDEGAATADSVEADPPEENTPPPADPAELLDDENEAQDPPPALDPEDTDGQSPEPPAEDG